jgi:predicted AAA+ superfamily ATPase
LKSSTRIFHINFSRDPTGDEKLEAFLKNPSGLLLLDEITYLENYDVECEDIYNIAAAGNNFKTVITGSSPAHISKLGNMRLGGGRARVFYLPLITFTEYLHFTDRIESYSSYENACASDFKDYLQLKGLNQGLSVVFDMQNLNSAYDVNGTSNNSRKLGLLECGA